MALSDDLKEYLKELGIPERKTLIVPLGIDTDIVTGGDGEKIRKRLELQGTSLVLYTGTLEEFQRIDYLLQALKVACKYRKGIRLLIVNNVPNADATEKYIAISRSLGIGSNVTFIDGSPLSELKDYLAAADVTVISRPSCPGHPVKLLNYMSAGKATACFRSAGKGLHHMHNGYLAPDNDYEDLGRGIAFLLEHRAVREELGRRARGTIFGIYDWDTLILAVELCYEQLLEPKEGGNGFDSARLAGYLKRSYVPQFADRRMGRLGSGVSERRSGHDRRRCDERIAFPERRNLHYPCFTQPND